MSKCSTEGDLGGRSRLNWHDSAMGNVCMKKGNPQKPMGILSSFLSNVFLASEFFKDVYPYMQSIVQAVVCRVCDYFLSFCFYCLNSGAQCCA